MSPLQEELRTVYSEYAARYDLPDFEQLDDRFEITDHTANNGFVPKHFLRYLRRRIVNVMDGWVNYLHGIVLPGEQSMILYEEANHFTQEEKDEAFALIKRVMRLGRKNVLLETLLDEEEDAAFIQHANKEWESIREDLKPFVEKSRSVWEE